MKMTSSVWLAGLGIILAGTAFGTLTSDNFESYTNNQSLGGASPWGVPAGTVIVETNLVHGGTKAAQLAVSSTLSNTVNYTGGNKVWTDFYTVPRLYVSDSSAGPAADPNATAQFYLTSNGCWATISRGVSGITTNIYTNNIYSGSVTHTEAGSNWVHVSVLHNYARTNWSLFVDGAPVATNLGFITTAVITNYNWFSMQNGGGDNAWLDDVVFTNGVPVTLTADGNGNGLNDAWEAMYLASIDPNNSTASTNAFGLTYGALAMVGLDINTLSYGGPLPAALPFSEYFDSYAPGALANGWDAQNALVVGPGLGFFNVNQSVNLMGTAQAAHDFFFTPGEQKSNVWTHFVLKPVLIAAQTNFIATQIASPGDVPTVRFYVDNKGVVNAWSNNAYVQLTNFVVGAAGTFQATNSTQWYRFITKSDYAARRWSLYAGPAYGSNTYIRLLGDNLAFDSNATAQVGNTYKRFTVNDLAAGSTTGYLDNVEIALTEPTYIDSNGDGIPDIYAQSILGSGSLTDTVSGATLTNRLIAYAMGATNAGVSGSTIAASGTNGAAVTTTFTVGGGRLVTILTGTTPGQLAATAGFTTPPDATTVVFTNTVSGTNRLFYTVAATSPDGSLTVTNPVTYALYSQPRNTAPGTTNYYWTTPPVDYAPNNTLSIHSGSLGEALAMGLVGGQFDPTVADSIEYFVNGTNYSCYLYDDGAGSRWWQTITPVAGQIASDVIPRGTAFMIKRRGAAAAMANAVFTGPVQTNLVTVALTGNGNWNMIGWPYDNTTSSWAFANAQGSTVTTNADTIYMLRGGTYVPVVCRSNRVWTIGLNPNGSSVTTIAPLQPGEGIMYRRVGATTNWSMTRP